LNETFRACKKEDMQVRSPVAEARDMGPSDVLKRLDGSTHVNDDLTELRRQVVGQVPKIEVPLGQEHQYQRGPRRFGESDEAPLFVLPHWMTVLRGTPATGGRIFVVTGSFRNFGSTQPPDAKTFCLKGKGLPRGQCTKSARVLIVRERDRVLEVLIRRERHRRIVTQLSIHFSSSIPGDVAAAMVRAVDYAEHESA
jgi:hypothetical protein